MADNEVAVHSVQWSHVLSVGHILRAFRIALWPPSKLLLCLAALVITIGAAILLDMAFETNVGGMSFAENMREVYYLAAGRGTSWALTSENLMSTRGFYYSPLDALRHVVELTRLYWQATPWFAFLNTLIGILVWTFFGGAVSRIVALQFARDERPTVTEALRFACKRYVSLVASPLALFIVIALIAIPAFFVAGLVLVIPFVGELVAGALFFLTIGLGVVLTFLFLFGVASLGLQMPAIGAEGRDAFDAISRGVNYVFTRPWKYILYTAFSLLYLCFTFVVVRLFTFLVLKVPYASLKLWPWIGRQAEDGTPGKLARVWVEPAMQDLWRMPAGAAGTELVAAVLVSIFIIILIGLMLAFIPSFILSAQTIIYFLLRRQIDFKDLEEVYTEDDEESPGLARLEKTEEAVVEPEPPAAGSEAEQPAEESDSEAES